MLTALWPKFSALYGAAFTKPQGAVVDTTGVWQMTLSALSQEDIDYGFQKLVLSEQFETFPPNPKQFRTLCLSRRDDIAMPSLSEAFNAAKNYFNFGIRITSHRAVLFCALKVGETAFEAGDEQALYTSFKSVYERVSLAVNQGLSLPSFPEKKVAKTSNPAIAKQHLSHLTQLLTQGEKR